MRRLGSSAGSRSQPEPVRAGEEATATRGDSEASGWGGRCWLSRQWDAELPAGRGGMPPWARSEGSVMPGLRKSEPFILYLFPAICDR